MRTFVQPIKKKPKRTKRMIVRTENKKNSNWQLFFFYYRKLLVGVLGLALIVYIFFINNRSPITYVVFSDNTQATYMYTDAFSGVITSLKGQSYVKMKLYKRNGWVNNMREQYPLIKDVKRESFYSGTLTIDIEYHQPDFILYTEDNIPQIAYNNNIFPTETGYLLGSTGISLNIAIPNDMVQTFSGGIFWGTTSQQIARTIKQIDFLTGINSITYYPGREKLEIKYNNLQFIFALDPANLKNTFAKRQRILPYLPISDPAKVDLSNSERIIIQQ